MARAGKLIAALALAVLLAHMAVLHWISSQWLEPELLKPLATPMLTRQIVQQAPATRPVAAAPKPPAPLPVPGPVASALAPTPTMLAPTPTMPEPTRTVPDPQPALPVSPPVASTAVPTPVIATPTASTATVAAASPALPASSTPATASTTAAASYLDDWPADTRLSYKVSGYFRGNLSGDAQVQWLRVRERYEVSIGISIGFLASTTMTSQGEIRREGLHPLAYQEMGRGSPRRLSMADSGIVFSNGNTLQRPQGVQDTASQFVELSQQFASGRASLQVGNSVSFPMARPGAVDYWTYDVTEKVTLNTPKLGAVEAYHLKPRPLANPRGNITAEMWFAPSLQYLPVRIRINMGDAVNVDLMVDKIEQK